MSATVRFTPRAAAQAEAASEWWRRNREASPDLFAAEFERTIHLLEAAPNAGRRYKRGKILGLRRILLPRTRYHLYYVFSAQDGVVLVLALWSAVRGRPPPIG